MQILTIRSYVLCQVFLLLASLLVSSSLLNNVPTDPLNHKYKYYSNKKGTQVVEIGPRNSCHIFMGEDAAWLMENMQDEMTRLNYIQFRLLVGKCQLDAIFKPLRPNPQQQQQQQQQNPSNNHITTLESNINDGNRNQNQNQNQKNQTLDGIEIQLNTNPGRNETNHHSPIRETIDNTFNNMNEDEFSSTTPAGSPQVNGETTPAMPLIFPGTKWCGAGSSARFHDDLGLYVHTDRCCREHDLCPENMGGRECKYGLCNDSDFTRSSCDCDYQFRMCLQRDRSLSSLASFKIANLYFNILKPLCYARRPPVKSCRRHRITGECVDFEFDDDYDQEWQFFPAQPYLSEAVEKLILPSLPLLPPPPSIHVEDRVQLLSSHSVPPPPPRPPPPAMQPPPPTFSSTTQPSNSKRGSASTTTTTTATEEDENDDEEEPSNEEENN